MLKRSIENKVGEYKKKHPVGLLGSHKDKTEIVDITLSFNNYKIIKLLKERG